MTRTPAKFGFDKLVLASNNKGKLKEFQAIFSAAGIEVEPQSLYNVEDAEETGLSFVENAIIKARHACTVTGLPALSDDSGLEVDALQGQPGIYSARFSGANATDATNNAKLLELLRDTPDADRTARFHCVLVLMRHAADPVPLVFHGQWEGVILHQPSGTNGFGYDPLFFANEQQQVSAELEPAVKNRVSHRGQAVNQLLHYLQC
jgi:XTP/dITP diphosphohydrolase